MISQTFLWRLARNLLLAIACSIYITGVWPFILVCCTLVMILFQIDDIQDRANAPSIDTPVHEHRNI